jgi:hypothetical protein
MLHYRLATLSYSDNSLLVLIGLFSRCVLCLILDWWLYLPRITGQALTDMLCKAPDFLYRLRCYKYPDVAIFGAED